MTMILQAFGSAFARCPGECDVHCPDDASIALCAMEAAGTGWPLRNMQNMQKDKASSRKVS